MDDMDDVCRVVVDRSLPALKDSRVRVVTSLATHHAAFRGAMVSLSALAPDAASAGAARVADALDGLVQRVDTSQAEAEAALQHEVGVVIKTACALFESFATLVQERQRLLIDDFFRTFYAQILTVKRRAEERVTALRSSRGGTVRSAVLAERQRVEESFKAELEAARSAAANWQRRYEDLERDGSGRYGELKVEHDSALRYVSQLRSMLEKLGLALTVDVDGLLARNADGSAQVKKPALDVLALVKDRTKALSGVESRVKQLERELAAAHEATDVAIDAKAAAEQRAVAVGAEMAVLRSDVRAIQAESGSAGQLVEEARAAQRSAEHDAADVKSQLKQVQVQLRSQTTECRRLMGAVKRLETELASGAQVYKDKIVKLSAELVDLRNHRDAANAAEAETSSLAADVLRLKGAVATAMETAAERQRQLSVALTLGAMTSGRGEGVDGVGGGGAGNGGAAGAAGAAGVAGAGAGAGAGNVAAAAGGGGGAFAAASPAPAVPIGASCSSEVVTADGGTVVVLHAGGEPSTRRLRRPVSCPPSYRRPTNHGRMDLANNKFAARRSGGATDADRPSDAKHGDMEYVHLLENDPRLRSMLASSDKGCELRLVLVACLCGATHGVVSSSLPPGP